MHTVHCFFPAMHMVHVFAGLLRPQYFANSRPFSDDLLIKSYLHKEFEVVSILFNVLSAEFPQQF